MPAEMKILVGQALSPAAASQPACFGTPARDGFFETGVRDVAVLYQLRG